MTPVSVIGIGLSPEDLTPAHLEQIHRADVLVGGKRHLGYFPGSRAVKKEITKDLSGVIRFIQERTAKESVVVLASGDPLFYGIGARLIQALGPDRVRIHPNISTLAAAFARIKEPWQDVRTVSLHGKSDPARLLETLATEDKIFVLTDPVHTPGWVADLLQDRNIADFRMCVLQQLGAPSEKVEWFTPEEAAIRPFAEPNVLILRRETQSHSTQSEVRLGLSDDAYRHREGLITKAEVRAVTLSKLRLTSPDHVLWDLGAGSGSVSIESALFLKRGRIFAVEKNPDRIADIEVNRDRFGIRNLAVVQTVLPDGLDGLPDPDRVFIGGGGKDLDRIIQAAATRLTPDGVIVVNTVLISNMDKALETLRNLDFTTEMIQIQVNTAKPMPWGDRLQAQNPVWIITGYRKEENIHP
ncbi:MAG: precorrin-6y C5,15-methyltransferase (decarboxylating) subunit CbiE [Thermodesulfobacteriota bacterium]